MKTTTFFEVLIFLVVLVVVYKKVVVLNFKTTTFFVVLNYVSKTTTFVVVLNFPSKLQFQKFFCSALENYFKCGKIQLSAKTKDGQNESINENLLSPTESSTTIDANRCPVNKYDSRNKIDNK